MITLTREEAEQLLAAFCQSSQPAPGYRRNELHLTPKMHHELYQEAIELLRAKLDEPEPWTPDDMAYRPGGLTQPEPPCKTGSQCVGGKCERCAV